MSQIRIYKSGRITHAPCHHELREHRDADAAAISARGCYHITSPSGYVELIFKDS